MQIIFWIWIFICSVTQASKNLETIYEWKYIDYLWESREQKESFIQSGNYIHENIVPIDVDKAQDGRVFITAIRNSGVPSSLAIVSSEVGPSGPLLQPYPDWSWFNRTDCDGITSVYRVAIDECNKMYVMDTGIIGSTYTCQAQILIFDLTTDRLVERVKIPDNLSQNSTGFGKLITPVIEVKGSNCEVENIFLADVNGRGLVIVNANRMVRLNAEEFQPEEAHVKVSIAGESFDLPDSLMGMAVLSKPGEPGAGDLFFRPFASLHLYSGDTRVLARSTYGNTVRFREGKNILPSQATAMGVSATGALFFGLTKEVAVGCLNVHRNMTRDNVEIIAEDENRLQFASGLKVLPSTRTRGTEEIWVFTNRLQKIMAGTQNSNEINFRVLRGTVNDLIRGSKCESAEQSAQQYS